MIHRETIPTGLQSQATGVQGSLRVAGYRQAKRSERRKASGRSVVAAQIFRAADSAFSGILCSVGDAARHQTGEGTAESTRCVLVGMVSCAVRGSMWGKPGSAGVVQWLKVEVHWSERHQQILGMGFAASTGTANPFETRAVKTVQPLRQRGRVNLQWWMGRPYPSPWQVH